MCVHDVTALVADAKQHLTASPAQHRAKRVVERIWYRDIDVELVARCVE